MAETDFEKERRMLKELEGKNIANYKVLLTALIRTTMENVRTMAVLSAAGIGLLSAILMFGRIHDGPKLVIAGAAFLGFFVSLVLSLGILERNARYLAQSLKGGSETSLDLENCSKGGKQLFFIGCVCLIILGLMSVCGPKWGCCMMGKKTCPITGPMMKAESQMDMPVGTYSETKESVNSSVKPGTKTLPSVPASSYQTVEKLSGPENSTSGINTTITTQDVSKSATATSTSRKTPKGTGNAGNFKGGAIY